MNHISQANLCKYKMRKMNGADLTSVSLDILNELATSVEISMLDEAIDKSYYYFKTVMKKELSPFAIKMLQQLIVLEYDCVLAARSIDNKHSKKYLRTVALLHILAKEFESHAKIIETIKNNSYDNGLIYSFEHCDSRTKWNELYRGVKLALTNKVNKGEYTNLSVLNSMFLKGEL